MGNEVPGAVMPSAHLALVIGNDGYRGDAELHQAHADAVKVAEALSSTGYTLIGGGPQYNLDSKHMRQAIRALEDAASRNPGALVVFYFAGHGHIESGKTALEPVPVAQNSESDGSILAIDIATNLRRSQTALTIMFLDNCRNIDDPKAAPYIPEQLPSNTFIGYSTTPGGIASDENAYYADILAQRIRSGFDTLVDMHLKITTTIEQRKHQQIPVFNVSTTMPISPVIFYPKPSRPVDAALIDPSDPRQELARRCDNLTHWWELQRARQHLDDVPSLGEACLGAWNAGWRTKEVMRGVGFTTYFVNHSGKNSPVLLGLVDQASELGDGTSAMYHLLETMTGSTPAEEEAMLDGSSIPSLRSHMEKLFEQGLSIHNFDINSIQQIQAGAIRSVLSGNDFSAVLRVAAELGYGPQPSINGHLIAHPERYDTPVKKAIIKMADTGFAGAIAYLLYQEERRRPMVSRKTLRYYLILEIEGVPHADPYEDHEPFYRGFIGKKLLNDLYSGVYGPRDQPKALEMGVKLEKMFPGLAHPVFLGDGPNICLKLAVALLSGRTADGSHLPINVEDGQRLLRYAIDHQVPGARDAARRYHVVP